MGALPSLPLCFSRLCLLGQMHRVAGSAEECLLSPGAAPLTVQNGDYPKGRAWSALVILLRETSRESAAAPRFKSQF